MKPCWSDTVGSHWPRSLPRSAAMSFRSPRLAPFFQHVPMSGLVEHQTMFMAMVMGGPSTFSADQIEEVHQRLGIADEDSRR